MGLKHIDDKTKADLKTPYYRITVQIEKVFVDETHPAKKEGVRNFSLGNDMVERQSKEDVDKTLELLGANPIADRKSP